MKKNFSVIVNKKIKKFNKTIEVDSDKSISIRSFLISSISQGISEVSNTLESQDVFDTISSLKKLNCKIKKISKKKYLVYGKGLGSYYTNKSEVLNLGNSGTGFRLLSSICSTTPNLEVKITGDASLKKRNMSKLINILSEFGATFTPKNKNFPPFKITSSEMPVGINYKAGVSAQLKSACILAALNSYGITNIVENRKIRSRDHTENILLANSDVIKIKKNLIKVEGKRFLEPINIKIPADPSSSAFFTAITLFSPGSKLKIKNVLLNPTRIGFYKLLKKHGANIKFKNIKKINNEVVGDIFVKASKIQPIKASAKYYPSTADEYPILFVMASLIKGVSVFNGISDLANKESSRAHEMRKILKQIGIKCKLTKDTMKIFGTNKIKSNGIIKLGKLNDHRLCMSLFCLSTITGLKSYIKSFETVFTSCPSFLKNIKSIGGGFHVKKN
mgnify:FL=1|tara:strand:+ start:290 stop:1630 length:1341 start_codon:yes stop_codon:yes gene_type:complete